jgi:hypothetical protein
MTFGALRGVVHSFGAHAVALVQTLCGEVDGGRALVLAATPTLLAADVGGSDAEDEGWG